MKKRNIIRIRFCDCTCDYGTHKSIKIKRTHRTEIETNRKSVEWNGMKSNEWDMKKK